MQPLKALEVPGFRISESRFEARELIPARQSIWAGLCLAIEGEYQVDWGRTQLRCGPASLVFHAPGDAYSAQISAAGSRCLMVAIDPLALDSAAVGNLERFSATRRPPPYWLVFELRLALDLRDELTGVSLANAAISLLAELDNRPGLEARGAAPLWLRRVQEQIHDEFHLRHSLESLARTAGVHHVHLARQFIGRFGCTIGHYIRQRRIEFACDRLITSKAPLSEIGLDAGFADQSHFTNTFRRLVGISPGVFRKRFSAPPARTSA